MERQMLSIDQGNLSTWNTLWRLSKSKCFSLIFQHCLFRKFSRLTDFSPIGKMTGVRIWWRKKLRQPRKRSCSDTKSKQLKITDHFVLFRKQIASYDSEVFDLGNTELTRLWNIEKSNLAACKAKNRVFDNILEPIINDVLDEVDPEQQVEKEYM